MVRAALFLFAIANLLTAPPRLSAQSSPPGNAAIPVIKTGTTNILVDVVVTDHHGHPVDNLQQENFTVFENGRPQQIVSFEAHLPSTLASPAAPPLPTGVYTNAPSAPEGGVVDVLLIDALNTPVSAQVDVHRLLVQYLKTLPPDKPVAVFMLSTQLRQLEDFTSDHTALLKAVDDFTRNPAKPSLLRTKEEIAQELKDEDEVIAAGIALKKPLLTGMQLTQLQQFEAEKESSSITLRVQYSTLR